MAIKISKNRMDMGSTPIKNVSYQDLDQVATQAAPATGKTRFYSKTDGSLYVVPAAGSETAVGAGVAANVVAYFNGAVASIPSGWTEFTAARGRMIVGVPLSGTVGGTVGTALTNLEDRTHTHTGPSHTHTGPSHTHSGPSHQHDTPMDCTGSGWFKLGESYGTGGGFTAVVESAQGAGSWGNTAALSGSAGTGATGAAGTGATGADGTGATGTAATSNVMAYINQPAIVKS